MTFATYSPRDDERLATPPAPAPAQPSNVERFIAARVRELINLGWTWGQIATATGLTPAQAEWYANHA